jgi:hypothetical protein
MGEKDMNNDEVKALVDKYFQSEGYTFPADFEHRVDNDSLSVIYSFVRDFKPKSCLQIGTWEGGTTLIVLSALLKNKLPYTFVASELLNDKRENTKQHAIQKCGVAPTMIGDITKCLDEVPEEIDFLYHDSDHDAETTVWVYNNIFPRLKDGALVIFHDWAVEDHEGVWSGKGPNGTGGWPETTIMMDLHNAGKLPLEKVYWNYHNPGDWETGVFYYRKPEKFEPILIKEHE